MSTSSLLLYIVLKKKAVLLDDRRTGVSFRRLITRLWSFLLLHHLYSASVSMSCPVSPPLRSGSGLGSEVVFIYLVLFNLDQFPCLCRCYSRVQALQNVFFSWSTYHLECRSPHDWILCLAGCRVSMRCCSWAFSSGSILRLSALPWW